MKIYLISFLAILFNHVLANDCSPIELDNNGSMSSIKAYHQGSTNTCYAHTGAIMLDAWLHSHGGDKSKNTSPFAMALLAKAGLGTVGLSNISCNAINKAFKHGRCLNDDFNQNLDILFSSLLGEYLQRDPDENIRF